MVQLRFNRFLLDPINILVGAPQGSPLSPVLLIIYTGDLLHKAESWHDCKLFMYIDDSNILASGPLYRVVATTIANRYRDCLQWLCGTGLSIKSEKTEVIFYSHTKPCLDVHSQRPASIRIPAADREELTVQSSNTVRYLGLYINHKLNWFQHITIIAMHTCRTLKALQLLGNSIRGLDHGNWRLAYNAICLPVLTYSSLIWFNDQQKLTDTLQQVQDYTVHRIMGAFCTTPAEPLYQLCAILPMKLRLQMLSKSAVFSLLSIPHSSQLIQWLGPPWCEPKEL
jgi:Reverse transcriptase (RNA-dependent DNA polymerase)